MKKNLLILSATFLALCSALAADPPVVYEKTPLPSGALLASAPAFSKWEIDFTYGKQPDKNANLGGDPTQNMIKTPTAVPPPNQPKQVTVTRAKPRWHGELVYMDNSKKESWFDGSFRYEVEKEQVIPIAQFNPGYSLQFLDFSEHDFPDLSWISASNYLGTQKGTSYWVFQTAPDGMMAWIDSTTRLPYRWQNGQEIRTFKFLPAPTSVMSLPDNIEKVSKQLEHIQQMNNQVPGHR